MLELLWEALHHAFLDGINLLPFLFGTYLLIEWLEHKGSNKLATRLQKAGHFGPAVGALLGCVPQCGFSVAAANFYAGRILSLGTLLAVFLSTSEEAVPILLAQPEKAGMLLPLLGCKILIGALAGFAIDALHRPKHLGTVEHDAICDHCGCEHHSILRSAVLHTLQTFAFILIVLFALELAMHGMGHDWMSSVLMNNSPLQPLLAGLIGFIPGCVSSVVLTELYMEGVLSFGAVIAGLCTGSGMGLAVLFRMNRNWKENLSITGLLYLISALAGMLLQLTGI